MRKRSHYPVRPASSQGHIADRVTVRNVAAICADGCSFGAKTEPLRTCFRCGARRGSSAEGRSEQEGNDEMATKRQRRWRQKPRADQHWYDVPTTEKRRLMKTGLRCPGCKSENLGPLEPGCEQMLCSECHRILAMSQRLRLRTVGWTVDGIRCYLNQADKRRQNPGPPKRRRHE